MTEFSLLSYSHLITTLLCIVMIIFLPRLFINKSSSSKTILVISIISLILIDYKFSFLQGNLIPNIFLVFTPIVGMLMVSNIIFAKKTFLNRMKKFNALVIVSILSVAILTHIEIGSFVLFYSYLIFGLARFSMQKIKKNKVIDLET